MTVRNIFGDATPVIIERVFKGRFRIAEALNAAKGFERYRNAVETGNIAENAEIERRRMECRTCPSLVETQGSHWCGEPFVDHTDDPERATCGCLIGAKTLVASEQCPQGRWGTARKRADLTVSAPAGTTGSDDHATRG